MTKDRICSTDEVLPKITRRAILASVPAIAAGTLPSSASTPETAEELFQLWLAESDRVDSIFDLSDDEMFVACMPLIDLEGRIMAAPILTAQDLAVKLVVCTDFGGYDDIGAMRQAASLLGQSHRIHDYK